MSFVREEITTKLLNSVNMKVEGPLPSFIQNYLSFKYGFVPPHSNKRIISDGIGDLKEFAIYMFQCDALLNVEGLEFDYSCFIVSKEHLQDIAEYSIPNYDGNDYVIRSWNHIDFHFIKTPFFMINNIVHPETYDTKTLYLSALYEIHSLPYFDKNLMPFGEGIMEFFKDCSFHRLQFKDVVSKLILSQFPSFNDYYRAILPVLLNHLVISNEYTTILPVPNNFSYTESKSSVLLNVNVPTIITENYVISEYDEKLMKKYEDNLNSLLPFETPVYSYPIYSPLDKKIVYYGNSALNCELYMNILSRVKEADNTTLERIYKLKKSIGKYLKGYYFAYHMQHSIYSHLYPVSPFPSPKIVYENKDIYYPTWTLNQIKSIKNKEDLFKVIIKTVWHNNKFMVNKLDKDLKTLINNQSINDLQFYNKITELYKINKPKETGFDRGQFRFDEINKLGLFNDLVINDYTKYLDFGGGIGDVSSSIAKNLRLKKENSFVTDIQNWLGKEHTDEYVKHITYRYLKTNLLPFEKQTFDLITCLQVLHHIPDKKYTISQLRKVIKSTGILIVREHDCRDVQDRTMIDIEHSLHAYAVDEQGIDYFQNYHDNYMSKSELSTLMIEGGFELVNTFPEKGITRYYYSVWKPASSKKVEKPSDRPIEKPKSKSWADDYSSDEEEEVDLSLDKNKQPNLTFKQLSSYNKGDVVNEMKNIGFPYHKYYINKPEFYFNNLKNFKYTLNPEIVNRVDGIYFKSRISYTFKEPQLFGMTKSMTPTLVTMKEDYNTIDVITNLYTEEERIKAKVYKGKAEAISPFEFWMTQKSKIIDLIYSEKQPLNSYTLREALFKLSPEATLFKTTVAKSIYDIFKPTHILDMSSGWGDRLIAAIAYGEASGVDVKYSGFDPNSSLKYKYMNIVYRLAGNKSNNFKVRTEPFETANLKDIKDVDLFFSSPPYFDFEIYTNEETQSINNYKTYNDWLVRFLFRSIKNAFSVIVKDGYFVMHITDTGNMRNVCELIKLYIEEHLDGSYIGCIFTQAPGKRRHPMWVFKKDQKVKTELPAPLTPSGFGAFGDGTGIKRETDKVMDKLYREIAKLIISFENEPNITSGSSGPVPSSKKKRPIEKNASSQPYDESGRYVGFNF